MKLSIAVLSLATLALAGKSTKRVNINAAPADTLSAYLPGVGPAIAERIVAARPFRKCADLAENVVGIGEKKIDKICPLLIF